MRDDPDADDPDADDPDADDPDADDPDADDPDADDPDADDLRELRPSDRLRPDRHEFARLCAESAVRTVRELNDLHESRGGAPARRRVGSGPSAIFTLRLDRPVLEALHARAASLGMPPSTLARNLLRRSLSTGAIPNYTELVEELERTTARLRALAP